MELEITVKKIFNPLEILVSARIRYWEDSFINGIRDTEDGQNIPLKFGDKWKITINLETGKISNWPLGIKAEIHYKVCDDGEYWLINDLGERAKYKDCYVPGCLGVNEDNFGDYIIMNIDEKGFIEDWKFPHLNPSEWEFIQD